MKYLRKRIVWVPVVLLALILLTGAVIRQTTVPYFQNGIATSLISPFVMSGSTSDLTMVIGNSSTESVTVTTDGGSVTLDGTLSGAGITSTGTITAAVGFDCTGAADCDYGSADITDHTFITDGTGDGEIVLPENSIGPDEVAVLYDTFVACGQQANNGTIYGGPAADSYDGTGGEYALGGTACDALDNATEATADAPISIALNNAFKVTGMVCKVSGSGSNGVALTLRSAEGDLTPSVTCTVATGETTCVSVTASTTDVAAGATVAVKAVNTEDLSAQDFWCRVGVAYKS